MPEIILLRDTALYVPFQNLYDSAIQDGNIPVDKNGYISTLDRIYNTKGLKNFHIEIKNTHATNGFIYKIEKCRKKYDNATIPTANADFDKDILGNTTVPALVAATATITLATVLAGDIVTINGLEYLAVAGVKSSNAEFSIDGNDTVDAADLADSINNDTRFGTLKAVTAISAVAIVTVTSTAIGTAGNAVTLAEDTAGARITISGPTFTGGVDNFSISDIIDISPESTAIRIRFKRAVEGDDSILAGIVNAN